MAAIAIVGGGLGGLVTAAALARGGIAADVFERRPSLPEIGTALGMWPAAVAAACAAGCEEQLQAASVPQAVGEILTWRGRRLAVVRPRGAVRIISRPALTRILFDAVPAGAVQFGVAVSEMQSLAGYSVVVAADGSGSALRDEAWGDAARPRPARQRVWRGTLAGPCAAPREWWGPGALFGLTPREDGDTNFFAAVRYSLIGSRSDADVLAEIYTGWPDPVTDTVEKIQTEPMELLVHELAESPALRQITTDQLALIGDAAHTMLPNLGRGACEAMTDGATLADSLARHGATAAALADYQSRRRRPAQRVMRGSRLMSNVALAARGTAVRDPALRVLGRAAR